jgi:hypothetical protein
MFYSIFKSLVEALSICMILSSALLHAECPIDTIIVHGRVEHVPRKAIVKVELVYPKGRIGESGDVTVEDGSFRIPILFFTQSRTSTMNGSIPPEKCTRKPKSVLVSLIANDQEYDRVSLDMTSDFNKIEFTDYALRSEILLRGPEATNPIQ